MNKLIKKVILTLITATFAVGCGPNSSSEQVTSIDSMTSGITSEEPSTSEEPLSSEVSSSEEGGEGIVGNPILPGEIPPFVDLYVNPGSIEFEKYQVWLWDDGGTNGSGYDWDSVEGDWAYIRLDMSTFNAKTELGIIVRQKTTWDGQSQDGFIKFTDFGQVDGVMSVYIIIGDGNVLELYHRASDALGDRIISADFTSFTQVKVVSTIQPLGYTLLVDGVEVKSYPSTAATDTLTLDSRAELNKNYEISATYSTHSKIKTKNVSPRAIYATQDFKTAFTYTGNDLGATYTPTQTTFKLWAPTSSKVVLRIYRGGTTSAITGNYLEDFLFTAYTMTLGAKGVWSAVVEGDLNLKYYTYVITNSNGTSEVVDPYAKSAGVNGLRGQIINFDNYESSSFDTSVNGLRTIEGPTDLVVYEMHVADLTWDQTWQGTEAKRGKYLGLIEEDTIYTEGTTTVSTGFDHLKELGINAIQLMPFYDQSNYEINRKLPILDEEGNPVLGQDNKPTYSTVIPSHNWGYNPLNFNVLEGQYSSNPYLGEVRIQEFKQVVETYAENDIRIIMDVVYNHVASASSSNFQKIVPGYYFRFNQDWSLNNDSGVGNVFASENPMASKFIIDSVLFWAQEYNIKGFRFDLMELISDSTLIALDQALSAAGLHDVVIWGEPWNAAGGYSGGHKVNRGALAATRVASFNDQGRNGLKGENNIRANAHWGWINKGVLDNFEQPYINKVKGMLAGIQGSYYDDNGMFDSKYNNNPSKAVNYAGSHDNFALYDQMLFSFGGNSEMAMRAATAANAIVLSGQGIPFFQGGDEIGRTKPFDETSDAGAAFLTTHFNESAKLGDQFYSGNSYNIGYETNSYKWNDKVRWLSYFNAYKNLINLRLDEDGEFLRLNSAVEVGANFRYWQNMTPAISWSAIASENKYNATSYTSTGAIYGFYTARLAENDTTLETFKWASDGSQVRVIYDSKGELTGQTLTEQVQMERFRVILVERL